MTGPGEPGDLYELLGIPRDASTADITRAYRRQARLLHPDARLDRTDEPERFSAVAAAYHVLGDPARRAAYDRALRRPGPASSPSPAPPAPSAGWPLAPWLAPHASPGGFLSGATLRAGPARVDPPGHHPAAGRAPAPPASRDYNAPPAGCDYDAPVTGRDYDMARLAALALLLARHFDDAGFWERPW